MSKRTSNGIVKSTLVVSCIVLVTKLLGFVRQMIISAGFGATAETDAFYASSSFVNSFTILVFSSLSVTLLSQYMEAKECGDENRLLISALKVFIPLSLVISALLAIGANPLSYLLAPDMSADGRKSLVTSLRILSIVVVPYGTLLILNVALEGNGIFAPGRLPALFQNVFVVVTALLFWGQQSFLPLVLALVVSFFVSLACVLASAGKVITLDGAGCFDRRRIKLVVAATIPLLVGNAIYEVNSIADKAIASFVGEGSISALTYGQSVNEIVSGIVIYALSTVLFAQFAKYVAKNDSQSLTKTLYDSLSGLTIVLVPLTLIVVVCSNDIVGILFLRGQFSSEMALATAGVVSGYALGFLPTAFRSILVKAHYAFMDTKTPMINGAVSVALNVILSILLSSCLGIGGIGVATSIAMVISSLMYLISIRKRLTLSIKKMIVLILKCGISGTAGIIFAMSAVSLLSLDNFTNDIFVSLLRVVLIAAICLLVDFVLLKLLKCRELNALIRLVHGKVKS